MIQIEMEMPDKCSECRFQTDYYFCSAMPKNFCGNTSDEGKPDWCPLKNVDGWVSTNDRMPGEWMTVLTFQPALSGGWGLIRTAVYIGTGKWREAERHELMELPVTHWMLLPEPPKGE